MTPLQTLALTATLLAASDLFMGFARFCMGPKPGRSRLLAQRCLHGAVHFIPSA